MRRSGLCNISTIVPPHGVLAAMRTYMGIETLEHLLYSHAPFAQCVGTTDKPTADDALSFLAAINATATFTWSNDGATLAQDKGRVAARIIMVVHFALNAFSFETGATEDSEDPISSASKIRARRLISGSTANRRCRHVRSHIRKVE